MCDRLCRNVKWSDWLSWLWLSTNAWSTDRVAYLFFIFLFFFNASFSLFFRDSLLNFEMGKVKVFFFIFYVLILLFFVLEILLIFLYFIFLGTASLNLEMGKIKSFLYFFCLFFCFRNVVNIPFLYFFRNNFLNFEMEYFFLFFIFYTL